MNGSTQLDGSHVRLTLSMSVAELHALVARLRHCAVHDPGLTPLAAILREQQSKVIRLRLPMLESGDRRG